MTKTARNERLKITATYFNGAAIAAIAVGGFAPLTTLFTDPPRESWLASASLIVGWFFCQRRITSPCKDDPEEG